MHTTTRRPHPSTLLLLTLLVGLVAYGTFASRPQAPVPKATVATVNLEKVFTELSERGAENAELEQLAGQLDETARTKRDSIELLRQDLDILPPSDPAYRATEEKLVEQSSELRAFIEYAGRKLDAEQSRSLRRLYDRIRDEAATMSAEYGYDIVLVDDSVIRLPDAASEAEMMRQISSRRMLHTNPAIDVTEDIILRLNNAYAKQQGS